MSRSAVRNVSNSSGETSPASTNGKANKSRSAAKIRKEFLEDTVEGASTDDVTWKELCVEFVKYIDGKISYKTLYNRADKFRTDPVREEEVVPEESFEEEALAGGVDPNEI